jgi:oligoribonuclease
MPRFEKFFHYRNIDVSTVKLLAQMWQPIVYKDIKKTNTHTALQDIMESIDELKIYKERWLTYTYY